jgi:hypothetical protein
MLSLAGFYSLRGTGAGLAKAASARKSLKPCVDDRLARSASAVNKLDSAYSIPCLNAAAAGAAGPS